MFLLIFLDYFGFFWSVGARLMNRNCGDILPLDCVLRNADGVCPKWECVLKPVKIILTSKWSLVALVCALVMGVGVFFFGFKQALAYTNTTEFCISCHEMRDNNYAEYKTTIHAKNRSGVVAGCSDCHVPHDTVGLLTRKVLAARDVYEHLRGSIDTPEKFKERRTELALRVWTHMKETDSAECRYCHNTAAFDAELQGPTARKQHQKIGINGKTCIDCHFGIAHTPPEGDIEPSDIKVSIH